MIEKNKKISSQNTLELIAALLRAKLQDGFVEEVIPDRFGGADSVLRYTAQEERLTIESSDWNSPKTIDLRSFLWNTLKLRRIVETYRDAYQSWERENNGVPYIPTKIMNDADNTSLTADKFIRALWKEAQPGIHLLMAEYGMGKTSFCQYVKKLAGELETDFQKGSAAFPFIFNLNDYRDQDFDQFIQNRLFEDYGISLEYKTFERLCRGLIGK